MQKERKVTNRQLLAISHIISSPSIEEASQKAKVSRGTIYKWLKDDDFCNELKSQRDKVINTTLERLKGAITQAVEELIKLTSAQKDEVRRLACNDIIAYTLKSLEIQNIEQRLDKIERIILEKKT